MNREIASGLTFASCFLWLAAASLGAIGGCGSKGLPGTGGSGGGRGGSSPAPGGTAGGAGGGVGGAMCPPDLSSYGCAATYDQQAMVTACVGGGLITTGQCGSGWAWVCSSLYSQTCLYDADKNLVGAQYCEDVQGSSFHGCPENAGPLGTCIQSGSFATDGGPDCNTSQLGDAGTARTDGGRHAGAVCSPLDLPTQCPGSADDECQPTWAAVLSHPLCMGSPLNPEPFTSETHTDCDAYHVRQVNHSDFGETYYYDITTGMLVAIYSSAGNGQCQGPPDGIQTSCGVPTPVCTFSGGNLSVGGDAGAPADGGAGSCLPAGPSGIFPSVFANESCARDSGAACYASCTLGINEYKYVGCVSGSSDWTRCYASCSECP